jgi:PTS system nitrogen regulatory IIA component
VTLASLLVPDGVVELAGKNRTEVLREMVGVLARSPDIEDPDALHQAIVERERLVSTGIGFGIAIPHAKIPEVRDFHLAVGTSHSGVIYPSIDDSLVRIVLMIAGPDGEQSRYLKILARVQRFLKNERDRILAAQSPEEIRDLLENY